MDTAKAELTEFKGLKDIKSMLSSPGPCVSVYMPLSASATNGNTKANALEWKETIRKIEPKLEQAGPEGRQLLETLADWDTVSQGQTPQGKTIAVFRSPSVFCVTWVEAQVPSRAVVGPHFYIRPLLPDLTKDKTFYILALSQKNVRLLCCTSRTSEEVPLGAGVATSFDTYMNSAKPDHNTDNMSSAGPSGGHTKGVMGSTSTEREDKDKYLAHFFKQIDRGVNEKLRANSKPLVLAAVEYELAQYRTLNTYPHLAKEDVQGAPNSLKSGEMHARALEAMSRCYGLKIDEVLAEYNHRVGGGASNRLKDVVTAAHDGRVLTLLVSDSLEKSGTFDESTNSVHGHANGSMEDEDLVNDAVVQTVLHAGQVYVAPNTKMPNGTPLAAVYRF